jgi:hypothetical protein
MGFVASSPFAILERDTPRRIIFGLLLVGAAVLLFWVTQDTRPTGKDGPTRDPSIEAVFPTDGSDVLRQSEAGIDLVEGYRASLSANGTAIPGDQITGIDSDGNPSLARYSFAPSAGKVIETWRTGQNCMTATYWPADAGPGQSTTYSWCWTAA